MSLVRVIPTQGLTALDADRVRVKVRRHGLRIGTTEATRLGMGPAEMERIADLFAAVLIEGRNVRREATELRSGFQHVHYVFE